MRSLTRLGVTLAATALASATALSGASAANAQFGGDAGSVAADAFTTRSASTIDSQRTADGVEVSYTNKTDRSLVCFGVSAPSRVVKAIDDHVKRYGVKSMTERAGLALQAELARVGGEDLADKVFVLNFDGSVTGAEVNFDGGISDYFIDGGESYTWDVPAPAGYTAEALLVCGELNEDYTGEEDDMEFSYVEYLSTAQSGGVFGSLGS